MYVLIFACGTSDEAPVQALKQENPGAAAAFPKDRGWRYDQHTRMAVCHGPILIFSDEEVDPPTEGGSFAIDDSFASNVTAAQRHVIEHAVGEWESHILDSGVNPMTYPISFEVGQLPSGVLAVAKTYWTGSGSLIRSEIAISSVFSFYVDPTPESDSEYGPDGMGGPNLHDLLTVMRHEIGHALGWNGSPLVSSQVSSNNFDPGRLNIAMNPASNHSDHGVHVRDLMNAQLGKGDRRSISNYPGVSLVARAYDAEVEMQYVDAANNGSAVGTADHPWRTIPQALAGAAAGTPLLVIPGSYALSSTPFTISSAHSIECARGGSATIGN